jgi:hypothetical protein
MDTHTLQSSLPCLMLCRCTRFCASSLEELQQQVTQKYVLSNISTLTTYGMVETSASSNDPTHAQQQQVRVGK